MSDRFLRALRLKNEALKPFQRFPCMASSMTLQSVLKLVSVSLQSGKSHVLVDGIEYAELRIDSESYSCDATIPAVTVTKMPRRLDQRVVQRKNQIVPMQIVRKVVQIKIGILASCAMLATGHMPSATDRYKH